MYFKAKRKIIMTRMVNNFFLNQMGLGLKKVVKFESDSHAEGSVFDIYIILV